METEFYKSIPPEIREKLQEYVEKYSRDRMPLYLREGLDDSFQWKLTPEHHVFWENHNDNNTFPIWSAELNRFIDPPQIDLPQVNTITVNADEYQAMREYVIDNMKLLMKYGKFNLLESTCKQMGIDINEITNV